MKDIPECFGNLDIVFPLDNNSGLRTSPFFCMECEHKTLCLKHAVSCKKGIELEHEKIDRAYASGIVGFFERWSRKKQLNQKKHIDEKRNA